MGCREEILSAVRIIIARKGKNEFSTQEVIQEMGLSNTKCANSTIATHISSRLCRGKNKHHGTTYDDLEGIGEGIYRLINP